MKTEELSLFSLKYFFDVVETGSLTKAAEINHVTRSAISQSIHRLENWAERKLTTHTKKNFQLTTEGEKFYRHMKASFQSFQKNVESSVAQTSSLKIGCSASLAKSFLAPLLKKLGRIDNLHLTTGTTSRLKHLLNEEEIHLALSVQSGSASLKDGKVISEGSFVLASLDGKPRTQIITTETRTEVTALKRLLVKQRKDGVSFLTVESWSLASELALELNCACLVPDFMLNTKLKKIQTRGLDTHYQIVLESLGRARLSELEVRLLNLFY